jgi:nifR3 family TIM-barrel protein
MNFWKTLPKPFWVLAPMEDVTDTVFRQIVASLGRPHVFFTEFTNVEAMANNASKGRLEFTPSEHPIVAQIWGNNPTSFYEAAKTIKLMGFDGIDINFGCPERSIIKQGACSALIGQEKLVSEIIQATCEGAGGMPVSVKTRIGIKTIVTEEWIGFLLGQKLAAITIHGRTVTEMSDVPAHWDEIAKAVKIRKNQTLIIGNGDVKSLSEAREKIYQTGVDGVMIGRGIFENPALFAEKILSKEEKLKLLREHIDMYEETWGNTKNFQILKKFVKTYISGFDGASEMRMQLMQAKNIDQLKQI